MSRCASGFGMRAREGHGVTTCMSAHVYFFTTCACKPASLVQHRTGPAPEFEFTRMLTLTLKTDELAITQPKSVESPITCHLRNEQQDHNCLELFTLMLHGWSGRAYQRLGAVGVAEQQALQDEQDLDAARFLIHALCLKALAVQGQAGECYSEVTQAVDSGVHAS
eukprot:scaffold174426_cov18-Tisochrysis_lutea.AAC.2